MKKIIILFAFFPYVSLNSQNPDQIISTYLDSIGAGQIEVIIDEISSDNGFIKAVSLGSDELNQKGLDKISLMLLKGQLEEISNGIYSVLSPKEKRVFRKIKLTIDRDTLYYSPIKPVYTDHTTNTLTFESKWYVGFLNYLIANSIETDPDIKREMFGGLWQYMKLTEKLPVVAFDHAALNSVEQQNWDSYSNLYPLSLLFNLNVTFIYLHEFAHLLNPEFDEIQADSFAIEKLLLVYDYSKEDLSDFAVVAAREGLPKEMIENLEQKNLVQSNISLATSMSLKFMIFEFMLIPSLEVDYTAEVSDLFDRLSLIKEKTISLAGCDTNPSFFSAQGKYCQIIRNGFENYSDTYDGYRKMHYLFSHLKDSIGYKVFNTGFDKIIPFLNRNFPKNESAISFLYGTHLLAQNYFNANVDYTVEAVFLFEIGTKFGQFSTPGSVEGCNLLLAKLHEGRYNDPEKAIEYYKKGMKISVLFPESFYEVSIGKLQNKD
jgi:hypothetical protein